MTESDTNVPTPASIPTTEGEWITTLNGRVVPEANQRLPAHRLPIGGKVTANTELDGKPAVLEALWDEGVPVDYAMENEHRIDIEKMAQKTETGVKHHRAE